MVFRMPSCRKEFRGFGLSLSMMLLVPAFAAEAGAIDDLAVTAEIRGEDGSFDYATIDTQAGTLYVGRENGVMRVNLSTGEVTSVFIPGRMVHMALPLSDGRILTTNGGDNTIVLANGKTGTIEAKFVAGRTPETAVQDPATGLVFVMNSEDGGVTVVDPKGPTFSQIPVAGKLRSAAADGLGHLFVVVHDTHQIAVVDTDSQKVSAHYALPDCDEPSGLALDKANATMVIACKNQRAIAMRTSNGAIVATIPIDRISRAVIFDPVRKVFFIPCARDATMAIIATNDGHPVLLRKILTAIGARTGALDTRSGTLYLPAANFSLGISGFTQDPGTFRVLVVGNR